jgi:hypothetical protein
MSSDEPKSAWEIALEKLNAQDSGSVIPLTAKQKERIAEIRTRFRAKAAELELRHQDGIRKTLAGEAKEDIERLREAFAREKERLSQEEESLVQKARGSPE